MVLQREGQLVCMRLVWSMLAMGSWAAEFDVVLRQNPVMEYGHTRRTQQLAICRKARAMKNDVIALPPTTTISSSLPHTDFADATALFDGAIETSSGREFTRASILASKYSAREMPYSDEVCLKSFRDKCLTS